MLFAFTVLSLVCSLPDAAQQLSLHDHAAPFAAGSPLGIEGFPRVFIGVLSAPGNFDRRQRVREQWLAALRASEDARAGRIIARFMIGRSSGDAIAREAAGHKQGALASEASLAMEAQIMEERRKHGDIERMPHVEFYEGLPTKVLLFLRRALDLKAEFVVKVDDDQHLYFSRLRPLLTVANAKSFLYGGGILWNKAAYKFQLGADGGFEKYYAGGAYFLSAPLARRIARQHLSHSVSYDLYGSSSEDIDMGRWVNYEDRRLERENASRVVFQTISFSRGI